MVPIEDAKLLAGSIPASLETATSDTRALQRAVCVRPPVVAEQRLFSSHLLCAGGGTRLAYACADALRGCTSYLCTLAVRLVRHCFV